MNRPRWASSRSTSKARSSSRRRERDRLVGLDDLPGRAPSSTAWRARALDDAVGVVTGHARGRRAPAAPTGRRRGRASPRQVLAGRARGAARARRRAPWPCAARSTVSMRGVGQDHPLDARVRDVALVPQGHVLEPGLRGSRAAPGPGRRGARTAPGCACAASPTSPSGPWRRAPRPRRPRCAPGGGPRWRTARSSLPSAAHASRAARRGGHGRSPGWPAPGAGPGLRQTYSSTAGIDVRVGADGARELAHRDGLAGPLEPRLGRDRPAGRRGRTSRRRSSARRACRACGPTIGQVDRSRARAGERVATRPRRRPRCSSRRAVSCQHRARCRRRPTRSARSGSTRPRACRSRPGRCRRTRPCRGW